MTQYWYQRNFEERLDSACKYVHLSARNLRLSARTRNAILRYNSWITIGEIILATTEIETIRNLGKSGLDELNQCITELINCSDDTCEYIDESIESHLTTDIIRDAQHSILSRCKQYDLDPSGQTFSVLPEHILELSIEHLQLPLRAHNALVRADLPIIASIYNTSSKILQKIPNLGTKGRVATERALDCLVNSLVGEQVDWVKYWQSYGIDLIPDQFNCNDIDAKVLVDLIHQILLIDFDERNWIIIQRRYALNDSKRLTLEDLGLVFNLTRERVRQLEEKSITSLKNALFLKDYLGKKYRIHPNFSVFLIYFSELVESNMITPLRDADLRTLLRTEFNATQEDLIPVYEFLLMLLEIEKIVFARDDIEPVWGKFTPFEKTKLVTGIEQIDYTLTEHTSNSLADIDLLVLVNRGLERKLRLTLEELRRFIPLCNTVEVCEYGVYRGRLLHLRDRTHQVQRILANAGRPMTASEIARSINHQLVPLGHPKLDIRNLRNHYLVKLDTFVPIGRSGQWALSSWNNIETGTIYELMEQCLISLNRPASPDEIFDYVYRLRPVKKTSIIMYLQDRDEFTPFTHNTWGLFRWNRPENAQIWNTTQVAEFIESYFKGKRTIELEYADVKQALMNESGLNARKVQGLLNISPAIQTKRENYKKLLAIFQPDFRDQLSDIKDRLTSDKLTIRQRVRNDVMDILNQAPGKQQSLAELRNSLTKKYQCSPNTLYTYIAELDYLQEVEVPGFAGKVYTIKGTDQTSTFPQIAEIQNEELQSKLFRSVSFLDLDNVDIGLFLLSKEFEATLKSFLMTKISDGEIQQKILGKDPSKWKLVNMIDCARDAGIITDHAIFHFLRQKRNDRAHGSMPSLDERRILMRNIHLVAGLYVDYIKLLDDLS